MDAVPRSWGDAMVPLSLGTAVVLGCCGGPRPVRGLQAQSSAGAVGTL